MELDTGSSSTFTEDGYSIRISSKVTDVISHPFEAEHLIQ